MNYVPSLFQRRDFMFKAVIQAVLQEAAALASLTLFVGMIAIWSQVFSNL
jgi:hypothetical protein